MHHFETTECPGESPIGSDRVYFPFGKRWLCTRSCCDYFTKFVQVYATKNKSALPGAEMIFNEFILKFGFPIRIHHDQGKELNNALFKRLHQLAGIASSRTTPYHPMGDGQNERMKGTIIGMSTTLEEKDHLSNLAFAYNSTVHTTT